MTDDPKKDNEIKDEDLKKVAGGVGSVDDQQAEGKAGGGGGGGDEPPTHGDPLFRTQKTEKA